MATQRPASSTDYYTSPIERLLAALHDVKPAKAGQWYARCPAHQREGGKARKLSIGLADDGTVLVHCYVGCDTKDVLAAVGLTAADLFPRDECPRRPDRRERRPAEPKAETTPTRSIDWPARAAEYAAALTPALRNELAAELGLPASALGVLRIGWCAAEMCWTFPETDGTGKVIGILRRWRGGRKMSMAGGQRGLCNPEKWQDRPGPVYLVEGPSDVLALMALGLSAIARPSNKSGVDHLAELMRGIPPDRAIIVLGEWDMDEKGEWPGRDGAIVTATKLAEQIGRLIQWALPPARAKDARKWATEVKALPTHGEGLLDAWQEAGEEFVGALEPQSARPTQTIRTSHSTSSSNDGADQQQANDGELQTTRLSTVTPRPVRWLVPGYIPRGKLMLWAGPGGLSKSILSLDTTACLTTGRPCFGLDYDAPPPGDVLLVSCEDGVEDTIVPRLIAAGADLNRVEHVRGIRAPDGKILPFNLEYLRQVEGKLASNPNIRFMVIDPAGAFIGPRINENKDAELRSLLDPLADLVGRYDVTGGLIKHTGKAAHTQAVNKVLGSVAWVNAVRCAYMIAQDEDDSSLTLFLPMKFNVAKRPPGRTYRLLNLPPDAGLILLKGYVGIPAADRQELAAQLLRIEWVGDTDIDPNSLGSKTGQRTGKVDAAAEWLAEFLAEYAYPSHEIDAAAIAAGITKENVWRAKSKLKEKGLRNSNRGGFGGVWWSGIGDPQTWTLRPEPALSP